MRKFIVAGLAVGLLTTGGMALAIASPGPNGNNTYGLCNAYSSGSDQGQSQKQAHGAAFLALEATATAWDAQDDRTNPNEATENDSQESTQQKVAEYCAANGQHP
jgi:hypothetical protein